MSALLVGYARCFTAQQDLTVQRDALLNLSVQTERIYVDHGLTGTNRERPGLREVLAACRASDTLAVTKLDWLARSLPNTPAIADELTARQVSLRSAARSTALPTPSGGCCSTPKPWSEFESELVRLRIREGLKIAKAEGRLRGRRFQPMSG